MNFAMMKNLAEHAWSALEPVKPHLDVALVGTFALSLVSSLPNLMTWITTLTTFAWSCVRLYETATVQAWLARRAANKAGGAT